MNNLNCALPHDLVVEILLRLPVRPLVRFKCVSTSWLCLISNPHFAKSHFDLAASPTYRLLLKRINAGSKMESLDVEASLDDPSAVVNLKFPLYSAPSFRTLGSCRGLFLLTKEMSPSGSSAGGAIVWNPSTGARREIPDWDSGSQTLYGFGYDPSNDDYLLVVIRLCEFEPERTNQITVFLGKTNVPSFYGDGGEYMQLESWPASGLYLNQSLHWLVLSAVTHGDVVIAFDLVERSLSEIPLSPDLVEELSMNYGYRLSVLGGCLSVNYSRGGYGHERTEIWVMKEYKVQESWTKSFIICVKAPMCFLPIWSTEAGRVLGSDNIGGLQKFNDKGELLERHEYGIEDKGGLKYFDVYRESLLTLPGGEC